MTRPPPEEDSQNRIVAVTLDEESIGRSGPDIEHERAIAIYDLIEKNLFAPEGAGEGPFALHLGITGNRLMFDIRREDGTAVVAHLLSLSPFRRIVKDYFMICDSYYQHRHAGQDRGHRYGPPRHSRRRFAHPAGAFERQGAGRFRNRPPAVHADLRSALEGAGRMIPQSGHRFLDRIMRNPSEA
jgi:hypothetical protein